MCKDTGEHLEQVDVDVFQGNIVFSTVDQLNFKSTSRRDDLISLLYILVYLLQQGNVPAFQMSNNVDLNYEF